MRLNEPARAVLTAQFRGIKSNSVEEFRDLKTEIVVYPLNLKSGDVVHPYADAMTR